MRFNIYTATRVYQRVIVSKMKQSCPPIFASSGAKHLLALKRRYGSPEFQLNKKLLTECEETSVDVMSKMAEVSRVTS